MREADLKDLIEASPNAYMAVDRELRIVFANPTYYALTGSTPAIIGQRLLEMFPNNADDPDDEPRRLLMGSLREVLRTKQRHALAYIPYRVPRAAGEPPTLRIWSASHSPVFDAAGEVAYVLQHTQDVTTLRPEDHASVLSNAELVQRTARTNDERMRELRAMFDQTPGFTAFLRGPDHVFELANPGYIRLIGGRTVLGLPIREAMPELADQGYYELLDRVYASGEPFVGRGMKAALVDSEGVRFDAYVDFIYQPVLADGGTLGILVQGFDITEQKRASLRQQFITRATEHLATTTEVEVALQQVAGAAAETVADFCIIDMFDSDVGRRIAATPADPADVALGQEMLRWPLPSGVPANHAYHQLQGDVRLVAPFTRAHIEASTRGPAYTLLLEQVGFRSVIFVPLWHRGHLYGLCTMITTHRSGRMYAENDLPTMRELGRLASAALDNARLTREREALLANERMLRASAEAANRAKDDFLAMLGHELRNPLAPILTAVQLMRMRGESTSQREQQIIERQAHHLVRLVDDLLDVSRIVHGKFELRTDATELAVVAAKAIEIATPMIEQRRHTLGVDIAPDLIVRGDEARLAQLIANLLTNAARYTPTAGRIMLSIQREDSEVVIRVRDSGVGLAPEMITAIFDMFVQAPQASDRAVGGLGIGLTLVKNIAELHGGTALATSAGLGHGSEFVVRLPALSGAPRDAASGAPDRRRVLVVDDNVDAGELLSELLQTSGHEVEVVHDGEQALARLAVATFDVAVVDIGLPRMDGHEVARAILARHGAAAPRLIALTGYGSEDDRARSREAGFSAHLTKPIDAVTLLRTVAATDRS